jgi:hypothetical protein
MMFHPLVWLAASLLGMTAWRHVAWRRRAGDGARLAPWLDRIELAYLSLVPLAALALRVVPPERLGLVPPRSAVSALLAAGLAALLVAARALVLSRGLLGPEAPRRLPAGRLLLVAVCLELHWAFIRAALLSSTLALNVAVFLSLLIVWLEWAADPWQRARLAEPAGVAALAEAASLALLSGLTFVLTGSSVLAFALHAAVRALPWRWPAWAGARLTRGPTA